MKCKIQITVKERIFLSMFADREIVNFQNTIHYVFGSETQHIKILIYS